MQLHSPFLISARLMPALKIGDAWLSLVAITRAWEGREIASFVIDYPDGKYDCDDTLKSGVQGFGSPVEAFASFLTFMSAQAEAMKFERRTFRKSDNAHLFPPHTSQWIDDNADAIDAALAEIQDENGAARVELIEE